MCIRDSNEREEISQERCEHHAYDGVAQRGLRIPHRVKRGRVQTAHRRGEKSDGRTDQDLPDPDCVVALEFPTLEQQEDDEVTESKESNRAWNDEIRDPVEAIA